MPALLRMAHFDPKRFDRERYDRGDWRKFDPARFERYRRYRDRFRAAIGFVNSGQHTVTAAANPITYSPTAGNTLVVCIVCAAASVLSTVADNATGGTSTYVIVPKNTNSVVQTNLAYCLSCKSGITTITVTFTASAAQAAIAGEYSGVQAINPTSVQNFGTDTGPTVSVTTVGANNWVVAAEGMNSNPTFTANVGNLRADLQNASSANKRHIGLVDNTAASPGSVTCSVTASLNQTWATLAIELQRLGLDDGAFMLPETPPTDPTVTVWQ